MKNEIMPAFQGREMMSCDSSLDTGTFINQGITTVSGIIHDLIDLNGKKYESSLGAEVENNKISKDYSLKSDTILAKKEISLETLRAENLSGNERVQIIKEIWK